MAILEKSKKLKVIVTLKGEPSVAIIATNKPQLIDGWLRVHGETDSAYFAESQVASYFIKNPRDSTALESDPSNGQYNGISAELASYKASRLTALAAETGQTVQLHKHLSVLLPIMQTDKSYG